jgi:hypothetical protein
MKGRRHSPEQVVRKLREADKLLAEGAERWRRNRGSDALALDAAGFVGVTPGHD